MKRSRAVFTVAVLTFPTLALAQSASAVDPGKEIVGWVCANQDWVAYVLGILIAHSGLSILSATLKKYGITTDSPIIGAAIPLIRALALDVKPPPAVIVAQAQQIQAAQANSSKG